MPSDNEITPEQDDEEDGTKTTPTLEVHTTAIDNVDLSMMFIRPPLRGVGLDGAVLRGDTIEVRRLKRLLRERDLNDEGNDVAILKLRLTHADLLNEISHFQKVKGNSRNITKALNNSLSKNTQMMRKLAKMHNAEMWRNLGNEKVKRFVETFTLVHHQQPLMEKLDPKQKFVLKDPKQREEEIQKKAKKLVDYATHLRKISQVRYRACALCEHRFDIRNLTKTVTLKSVWNKRKQFVSSDMEDELHFLPVFPSKYHPL